MSDVWDICDTREDVMPNDRQRSGIYVNTQKMLHDYMSIIDEEMRTLTEMQEVMKTRLCGMKGSSDARDTESSGESGFGDSGSDTSSNADDLGVFGEEFRKRKRQPVCTPVTTNDDENMKGHEQLGRMLAGSNQMSESESVCERQPVITTASTNASDVRVNAHDALTAAINGLAAELRMNRTREERIRLTTGPFDIFNGSENEKYPDWIDDVKLNVEDDWVSDELKLRHLKKRLGGKALVRFSKQLYNPTWKEALDHLERNYRIHQTITEKMRMFVGREQQGDECVLDYAGVLKQLCPFDEEAERESALKERLCAGLLREDFAVQAGVSADKGQSFGEVVEVLANQEEVEERRRKFKKSVNSRLNLCTRGGSEQSSDAISSVPDRGVQQIMKRKWGYRRNVRCYVCSGVGHKAGDHGSSGYGERYQMVNRESVRAQRRFQQRFYTPRRRMCGGCSDGGDSELGRSEVDMNWREQRWQQGADCDREIEEIQAIKKPGHIGVNKLVKDKCERMNCDRENEATLVKKKTGHSLVNEQDKCEQRQGTSCDRENQEISFKEAWSQRGQRAGQGRASVQWVWRIKEDQQ